jgi:hypothetical protein
MSSAEPFMPAHEPPAPEAPQEHDIDHDADVLFDEATDGATADAQPWHTESGTPTLPRPVPGAHLTAEQLAADLDSGQPE